MNLWKRIYEANEKGLESAICIVIDTKGSTPRKVGAKMIVYTDGRISGTIGGGDLEKKVIENALEVVKKRKPQVFKHDLLHQHNMCCGGSVKVYIEPVMKKNKLYIFGAGHTGKALSSLACQYNFDVYVIDERQEYLSQIPEHINRLPHHYSEILPSLPFDDQTFVVIMTYEHSHDRDILAYCIQKPNKYLGMIGSKRKVELTKKKFTEAKIATKKGLERVDMPMGFDINADGPNEIAISILAKLIEFKNKKNE